MLWIFFFIAQLVSAASFQGIQPVYLASDTTHPSNQVKICLPANETASDFKRLPTDVQILLLFDYLLPFETLRMRTISRYHRDLINSLGRQRLLLHCGPNMLTVSPKHQVAFALTHLQLLKAAFPVLPKDIEEADVIGLVVLAYFINLGNFDCALSRIKSIKAFSKEFDFFFVDLIGCKDRWSLFRALSRQLHRSSLQASLRVLYAYCADGCIEVKAALFEDLCAYFAKERITAALVDPFFAAMNAEMFLKHALQSKHATSILLVLEHFNLQLPSAFARRSILNYFIFHNVYDADLAEKIDFTLISADAYKDSLLLIFTAFKYGFEWLLQILQRAPESRLNSHYLALRDVFLRAKVPENFNAEELVMMLLAVGRAEVFVLSVLRDFLPSVNEALAPFVTSLASRNDAFISLLMLDNDRLMPVFYGSHFYRFSFDAQGRLRVDGFTDKGSVLPRILRSLGHGVFASRWFSKAFLMLIEDSLLLHQFSGAIEGGEVVQCSLFDLQKQASRLEWFSPDFVAINAEALLERQEWSMLELAILAVNPSAVQACLKGPRAARSNKKILELAQLVNAWMLDSEYLKQSERILRILGGAGEAGAGRKRAASPYRIEDARGLVEFETVPSSSLNASSL